MKLLALLGTACLACSSGAKKELSQNGSAGNSQTAAKEEAPVPSEDGTPEWFPESTWSVARQAPGSIMILEWLGGQVGGSKAPCWNEIMNGIRFGYQVEVEGMEGSFFAFTGNFDRSAVEKCAETAFPKDAPIHLTVEGSGDTSRLSADMQGEAVGEAALWWRSNQLVLAGSPAQIAGLREKKTAGPNACIKTLFPLIPEEPIAMARCDAFFSNVLGLPTVGWLAGLKMGEQGVSGKITVLYASVEEATAAAKVIATKDFALKLPEAIGDFIGGLPASVQDKRLELRLDITKSDFDKLSIEDMERLTRELKSEE